jgi:hypothetical protein
MKSFLFHRKVDEERFNQLLKTKINKNVKYQIRYVDSRQNFLVNIADMAAGAILWKYSGKDLQFYHLIKENIIYYNRKNSQFARNKKEKSISK